MRVATQLRTISALALAVLVVLGPMLFYSFLEFTSARDGYALAGAIKLNFFERAALHDQYFIHREDHLWRQWGQSKAAADRLLSRARAQFDREDDRKTLERLRRNLEDTAIIFHRIVDNNRALKAAGGRQVHEELDKRLSSQLLLRAAAVRDAALALEEASALRVEQSYKRLILIAALFVFTFTLVTILSSVHLARLIRRRLGELHAGAKIVAGGNLDHRIRCEGDDEFAELARSVNTMTDRLQSFTERQEAEIAARKRTETILRESEFRWKFAIEGAGDGLWDWNVADGTVFFTKRWKEMLGYAEDEIGNSLVEWEGRIHPDDKAATLAVVRDYLDGKIPIYVCEHRVRCKDGGYKWILDRGMVVSRDANGKPLRMIGTHTDISERRQAEESLRLSASVFGHALEAILIADADGNIINVNDTFTQITGYAREEVIGRNPRIFKSGRHNREFYAAMWDDLIAKGNWRGEIWNRRKNGEVYAELLNISAVHDAQGNTRQYVALFSDISSYKEHERQLKRIAHFDALTALPNRVLLADRMHQGMTQAQRHGQRLAVAYIDLDGFKAINDQHGHEAGDQLLMAVAARMNPSL